MDMGAAEAAGAAAEPLHVGAAHDLGGEDHLVALAARLEPGADDALGRAGGLGFGRDRIELGRVPEIDALVERVIHLLVAFGLGVLLAPGHGAEADQADVEAGAAELAVLHRGSSRRRTKPRC